MGRRRTSKALRALICSMLAVLIGETPELSGSVSTSFRFRLSVVVPVDGRIDDLEKYVERPGRATRVASRRSRNELIRASVVGLCLQDEVLKGFIVFSVLQK